MISFPCAKINLGLRILGKRPDGYHNIETVMYPVPLRDILEIVEGKEKDSLTISGLGVDCKPGDNLVLKAAGLLRESFSIPPLNIHVHKAIPFAAGLGGGSSDAVETIKALVALFAPGWPSESIINAASSIGSDCPFFIDPHPTLARGRGELLSPLRLDLSDWFMAIVKPPFNISTSRAYSLVKIVEGGNMPGDIVRNNIRSWKDTLVNDFEPSLFEYYPALRKIKESLYDKGAVYASLTGSGSAVFGIFENEPDIEAFKDNFTWKGKL